MAAAAGSSLPSSSFSAAAEIAGVAAAVAAAAAAAVAAAAAAADLAPAANSEPNPRILRDTGISYACEDAKYPPQIPSGAGIYKGLFSLRSSLSVSMDRESASVCYGKEPGICRECGISIPFPG